MQKLLFILATACLVALGACADEPAPIVQPAMAWTDPVIETIDRGGVTVEIFEKGTGTIAEALKQVSVHYTGWIQYSENVFDSSADAGSPISFKLGTKAVIAGWDRGLTGMTAGTRARLYVPSELAYGPKGRHPEIPGNANLVFDVELTKVQ